MIAKLKSFLVIVKNQLADIWNRSKIFLLAIGGIILAIEWNKLKEYLLVRAGQKELQNDNKKDQVLASKENAENKQADTLIQDANALPSQEQSVKPDWYKDE